MRDFMVLEKRVPTVLSQKGSKSQNVLNNRLKMQPSKGI